MCIPVRRQSVIRLRRFLVRRIIAMHLIVPSARITIGLIRLCRPATQRRVIGIRLRCRGLVPVLVRMPRHLVDNRQQNKPALRYSSGPV